MNIAFCSDLHIDFYVKPEIQGDELLIKISEYIDKELWLKKADVLVLAGDLSHYNQQNKLLLECIADMNIYKKIFVVPGNHDMYLISNAQKYKYKTSYNKLQELKEICDAIPTVEFLDGNIIEVDGIKFGGCAMWYDFSYSKKVFNMNHFQCMQKWKDYMNDANLIIGEDLPKEINDSRYMNTYAYKEFKIYTFDPDKFFKKEEEKMLKIIEDCDVFVSHFGPVVPPTLPVKYQSPETGFYYFNGEWLLEKEKAPILWLFGHTHITYDFKVNNTYLMCNPIGYKSEKLHNEVQVVYLEDLN